MERSIDFYDGDLVFRERNLEYSPEKILVKANMFDGGYPAFVKMGGKLYYNTGNNLTGPTQTQAQGAAKGAAAGAAIGSAVPVLGTAAGALVGGAVGYVTSKMGYADFIKNRDARLNELKSYGANEGTGPKGWTEELTQGFTHDQIKKDLLKDYSKDYQKFLDIVFFPILKNVNPAIYDKRYSELKKTVNNASIKDVVSAASNIAASAGVGDLKTVAANIAQNSPIASNIKTAVNTVASSPAAQQAVAVAKQIQGAGVPLVQAAPKVQTVTPNPAKPLVGIQQPATLTKTQVSAISNVPKTATIKDIENKQIQQEQTTTNTPTENKPLTAGGLQMNTTTMIIMVVVVIVLGFLSRMKNA